MPDPYRDLPSDEPLPLFLAAHEPEPRAVDRAENRAAGVALAADDPDRLCPHCGGKMVEYKHSLNTGLVQGLLGLWRIGGKGNVNQELAELGHNVLCNFQKLRYWDLVNNIPDETGKVKRGVWVLTAKGEAFLRGAISLPRSVWTYRAERVRYEGDQVDVRSLVPGHRRLEDCAREAVAHQDERRAS